MGKLLYKLSFPVVAKCVIHRRWFFNNKIIVVVLLEGAVVGVDIIFWVRGLIVFKYLCFELT